MRRPFILAIHTDRILTSLQSRRRGRLLEKSRCYRDYLKRLRRQARRRADHWQLPVPKGGLLFRPSALNDPEIAGLVEAIESLDAGMGKPHEQLMLELEVWEG